MTRKLLQQLTKLRLKEAKLLLDNRNYSGSYYLAGYTIEYALKACIAKKVRQSEVPSKEFIQGFYIHDLNKLVKLAGLQTLLTTNTNANFAANWAIVKDWKSEDRYKIFDETQANELYSSITSRSGGILKWIQQYW